MRKLKLFLTALALMGGASAYAQTWTGNEPAEGTFLLYNVGADKFINNGDPAQEWGTNAYLQSGFGLDLVLELNNGAYNLNTNVSNGGSDNYLGTSTWCDGSATPWTFTAVDGQEKTYTISNGSSYLVANDALSDIVYDASTGDSKSYWKLVSLADFKTAMTAHTYSTENPMDVSVFIKGRSFARNDGRNNSWTTTHNGGNWTWVGASANKYYGNESWNNTFSVSQTITDLPNGTYELQCSGFGTNGTTYIFGNSTSKAIQTDNTTDRGTNAAAKWTAIHEDNAFAGQTTGTFLVTDGTITLGLKRETNNGGDWAIWDEFRLYYYGLDLSAYQTEIDNLRTQLNTLLVGSDPMNASVKSAAQTVYDNTASVTQTEEAMNSAITDLNTQITNVNTSIAVYATFKEDYLDKVATLDEAGQSSFNANETAAALKTAYEGSTLETISSEQTTALDAALVAAVKAQTTAGSDWTLLISNPSFESSFEGWTNNEGMATQSNATFTLKDGSIYVEKWQPNGTFTLSQTISDMPAGVYRVSVAALARGVTSAKISAAGVDKAITVQDAAATYSVDFACDADADITISYEGIGTGASSSWLCVDNFTMSLVSAGLPDITAVEGTMNANVATAQTNAINTYNSDKTVANYNAAVAAIAAAQASVDAYTAANTAITKAEAIISNTNVYTSDAYDTFKAIVDEFKEKYDAKTLTTEESNTYTSTIFGTGWRSTAAVDDFLISAWDVEAHDWTTYHVNTWSTIDDSGNANFYAPCIEYWTGDENSLEDKVLTATIGGLNPGDTYQVTAKVCVGVKTGSSDTATGITLQLNDGDATNVCGGTQIGTSRFYEDDFTATGIIGMDGNLNVKFNVASTNVSWLTFRNVKYELTAEAAAATEEEKTALTEAIDAAENYTLGFENGEYAPYKNVAALEALATAKALDLSTASEYAVTTATTALTSATWTANTEEVNAIFDGSFASEYSHDGDVMPIGWHGVGDKDNATNVRLMWNVSSNAGLAAATNSQAAFGKFTILYGTETGYTMPLKAGAYSLKFIYGGWNEVATRDIKIYKADDAETTATVSTVTITAKDNQAHTTTDSWSTYDGVFTVPSDGDYVLSFYRESTTSQNQICFSDIEIKTIADQTVSVTAAGYATYVSDNDLDYSNVSGLTAYKATVEDETVTFTKVATVPAGEGVLLKGNAGDFNVPVTAGVTAWAAADNAFVRGTGATVASETDGKYNYILNKVGDVVGFYKAAGQTVATNRAYLQSTASAARLGFKFDGEATGIKSINVNAENSDIYNLNGMRVEKPTKGLYIMNGKKVVVK